MRRRTLLRGAVGVSLGMAAGCTASGPGVGEGPDPSDSPTETSPTPAPSSTPCPRRITATSFAVESVECATGENAASALVTPTGDATPDSDGIPPTFTVTVTGTIQGRDTCHRARLVEVEPVPAEDTLRVAIESYVPESNETFACGECIVDVDYVASVELACGYYGVATVIHDGEQVAEVPLPE